MKIANNLSTWLAVFAALPLAFGGITKAIESIRYDLIGTPRNDEEIFIKHTLSDHLMDKEPSQTHKIPVTDGIIIVNVFPDKCVVVKRKTNEGMVTAMKVLPDPEKIEKIKSLYSDGSNGIAYAATPAFDFGQHKNDQSYNEAKAGEEVIRAYKDKCSLKYGFDKYGNSKGWVWLRYNH